MTLTFDLLTPKSIGVILDSWGTFLASFMIKGAILQMTDDIKDGGTGQKLYMLYAHKFLLSGVSNETTSENISIKKEYFFFS